LNASHRKEDIDALLDALAVALRRESAS